MKSEIQNRVVHFISGEADIKFDRPIKFNISLLKLEQFMTFASKALVDFSAVTSRTIGRSPPAPCPTAVPSSNKCQFKVRAVNTTTEQVVVVLETVPHYENTHLLVSINHIKSGLLLHYNGR